MLTPLQCQFALLSRKEMFFMRIRKRPSFKESLKSIVIYGSYIYSILSKSFPNTQTFATSVEPFPFRFSAYTLKYRSYPVFTVLTTSPSEEVSIIHNRMPVIFPKEQVESWISPNSDPNEIIKYAQNDMYTEKILSPL